MHALAERRPCRAGRVWRAGEAGTGGRGTAGRGGGGTGAAHSTRLHAPAAGVDQGDAPFIPDDQEVDRGGRRGGRRCAASHQSFPELAHRDADGPATRGHGAGQEVCCHYGAWFVLACRRRLPPLVSLSKKKTRAWGLHSRPFVATLPWGVAFLFLFLCNVDLWELCTRIFPLNSQPSSPPRPAADQPSAGHPAFLPPPTRPHRPPAPSPSSPLPRHRRRRQPPPPPPPRQ